MILAAAILLAAIGYLLVWSGLKGENPLEQLRTLFAGVGNGKRR